MSTVVCLIANPATTSLSDFEVGLVRRALPETELEWLARGEAAELGPVELEPPAAQALARQALDDYPIDVVALPFEGRRKQALLCDMDSTVIQVECVDELAAALGIGERVAAITQRAMNGELDFVAALEERVGLLEGLELRTLERVAEERTPLTPGARTLVQTMRQHGAITALVSGGFTFFTERVAARCGFAVHEANSLDIEKGRLTGRLAGPIRGKEAKVEVLNRLVAEADLTAEAVIAAGDGANDIPMLEAAGLGVAFRAHQVVRAAIPARLDRADLTGLLYLQGYHRDDFVEG